MEFNIIKGAFSKEEALDIITKMIGVKIAFHESKIEKTYLEEDIKMRESRIKELQNVLAAAKTRIMKAADWTEVNAVLKIQ